MASLIPSEKQNESHAQTKRETPISMHEDIPVWYDCCSCEAEPYWIEAMAQAEIENGKQDK